MCFPLPVRSETISAIKPGGTGSFPNAFRLRVAMAAAKRVEMRRSLRHSPSTRLFAVWALAFALFVKALVAPGMMPVADAGGIRITLCTGAGPVEAVLDVAAKHHGDQGKAAHEPCPFGVLGMGALAADDVRFDFAALAPSLPPAALPPLPARAPPGTSLPPATGPPSFA
jgi:hypothetical protein